VSMIQYKQTGSMALRKWQLLALIILAFLTIVAISYFTLYTVGHIDPLHLFLSLGPKSNVMFGRP
jgi:hypothetical protein